MNQLEKSLITINKFPFYLRRSTYIHIGLFSLTLFGGKLIIDQEAKLRNANLELIQASVRVDMVAMPKNTLSELKTLSSGVEEVQKENAPSMVEPEKVPEVKEEPIKEVKEESKEVSKTESFEEANKIKRQNFLSKLKQIGSKKVNGDGNQKAEKGLYGEKSTDLKSLVMAGNKLNKGSAMYGSGNTGEQTAFQIYAGRLPDLVRPHWRLPSFLLDKKLKCRIRVWLASNGEITRAEVYQSSGDSEYDQRAIEAVKAASPFPKLADDFSKRGLSGDIALGFPL
jgi:colicin import membrane protein